MSALMPFIAFLMKSLLGPASLSFLVEVGDFTSSAGFTGSVSGSIRITPFPPAVALAPGSIGQKLPSWCLSDFPLVQALASLFDKDTFVGWFPSLQASPACIVLGDEG